MAAAAPITGQIELLHRVAPDHPAFAGHFPGQPIWPGVLLLCEVFEALRTQPALAAALGATPQLQSVKFLRPVEPGTELRIALLPRAQEIDFEVSAADQPIARGRLRAAAAA